MPRKKMKLVDWIGRDVRLLYREADAGGVLLAAGTVLRVGGVELRKARLVLHGGGLVLQSVPRGRVQLLPEAVPAC